MSGLALTLIFLIIRISCCLVSSNKNNNNNSCSFPPKPLGGSFKVLKLIPRKTVKYFCYQGYHLWGDEVVECDPEIGWQQKEYSVQCLVDVALNKIAFSSTTRLENGPLQPLGGSWNTKHKGLFRKTLFLAAFLLKSMSQKMCYVFRLIKTM